jgi:transmembrane sensor
MHPSSEPKIQESSEKRLKLSEEAADLLMSFEAEDTRQKREAIWGWATRSPEHLEMLLRASIALKEFDKIEAAREAAERRVTAAGPVPTSWLKRLGVLWWLPATGAAAVLYLALWGSLRSHSPVAVEPATVYDKAGFYALADASVMRLVERTRADVRHFGAGGAGREVTVLSGEAIFFGRHDRSHPLRVVSGRVVVDTLGTEFRVRRQGGTTVVWVSEGEVQVDPCASADIAAGASMPDTAPLLTAHHVTTVSDESCVTATGAKQLATAPFGGATSLDAQPRLVFSETPLTDAVAQFNRSNPRVLFIPSPELENVRIGGTYLPSEPDKFINFLRSELNVRAIRGDAPKGFRLIYLKLD